MPKEFQRIDRIAALIQRELAKLLLKEMRDPRLSLVTITHVKVSRDLAHAKVFVTPLQEGENVKEIVTELNAAAKHLRYCLAQALSLRITPALRFIYDAELNQALQLSNLIDKAVAADEKKINKR
jgi:ribosome-binding factor A